MKEETKMKVYKLGEVSEILHVTTRTLYGLIREGRLKAVKVGRGWLVSDENLREFMASGDSCHVVGSEGGLVSAQQTEV